MALSHTLQTFWYFWLKKKKKKILKMVQKKYQNMYLFIILFTNCFSTSFKICSRNVQSTVITLHVVAKLKTIFFSIFRFVVWWTDTDKVCCLTHLTGICQNIQNDYINMQKWLNAQKICEINFHIFLWNR